MKNLGLVLFEAGPITGHDGRCLDARDRTEVIAEAILMCLGEKVAGRAQSVYGIWLGPFPQCPRGDRACGGTTPLFVEWEVDPVGISSWDFCTLGVKAATWDSSS